MFKKLYSFTIFQISYLLFFAILPFIYSDSLMDPVLIPRQSFLTVFLIFIWIVLLINKKLKYNFFNISRLSLLLILCYALLIILSFITIIYSNTVSESIYVSSKYGIIFLFFITTYLLLKSQLIFTKDLMNGVLFFLLISLLYGIHDIFLLAINNMSILLNPQLITSTYANKNLFASVLLLCFWAVGLSNCNRLVKYFLFFLLFIFVIFIQSKIVCVLFILMLLFCFVKNLSLTLKNNKIKVAVASGIFLIILFFVFLNFSKFQSLSNLHTLDTRYSLWINSFKMIKEFPLGVGAGNWQIYFPKYGLSHFDIAAVKNGLTTYQRPHNDFFWICCELGIQGLILYLSIFLITVIMLVRLIQKRNNLMAFFLLINILGYCAVAFFDFPLERIEHQILLSVIIVISMYNYDIISKQNKIINPKKYSFIFLVFILISLSVCYFRFKGEYYTRQFVLLNKAKYADEVIKDCNNAKSFFYSIDPASMPIDWYMGISLFSQNKIEDAKVRFKMSEEYTPYNIQVLQNIGNLYERTGNTLKSKQYYKVVSNISPTGKVLNIK